jgi:hypothetical protein
VSDGVLWGGTHAPSRPAGHTRHPSLNAAAEVTGPWLHGDRAWQRKPGTQWLFLPKSHTVEPVTALYEAEQKGASGEQGEDRAGRASA